MTEKLPFWVFYSDFEKCIHYTLKVVAQALAQALERAPALAAALEVVPMAPSPAVVR